MLSFRFFPGIHQPVDSQHFDRACISINRLRGRKKPLACGEVLVDSGAFTELAQYGRYRHNVAVYARELVRLYRAGVVKIAAAVAQDYMCESFMLEKTGLTLIEHQRLTIQRYDDLLRALKRLFKVRTRQQLPFQVMPVLQGYAPSDYARHVRMYGSRLKAGMWVGVGSVCKRNGTPEAIVEVLAAIHAERPGMLLHGFGVKRTALLHAGVRSQLSTADSMAWSFAARKQGRDANDWREAKAFEAHVVNAALRPSSPYQLALALDVA